MFEKVNRANVQAWFSGCVTLVGSTRACSLLRMALVSMVWARFARELLYYRDLELAKVTLVTVFFLSSTSAFIGFKSRWSTGILGITLLIYYYYWGVALGDRAIVHHHVYLLAVSTFLLSLTPCGRSFSLDRWLALRKAEATNSEPPTETGDLWATRLICFQLSMVYFWGAFDKSEYLFLSGFRFEQMTMARYVGSDYPPFPWFSAMMFLSAVGTVALEYSLAIGLWFSKTRSYLIVCGIVFHFLIYVMFPVKTFSLTSIAIYLVFLHPDTVHRAVDRMVGVRA